LRAFQSESDLAPYFEVLRQMRSDHPHEPLEFMFYSDILLKYGIKEFVQEIISADVDAALLADSILMPEQVLVELDRYLQPAGIPRIRFMPHPFDEGLLSDFRANAREFVILQSIADQDGNRPFVDPANRTLVEKLHSLNMPAAVTLGYGINSPERVREALQTGADGIIVGTVLVEMIHQGDYAALGDFIRELKSATLL
jgi:tryptophan synthase alpha chain